MDGLGFVGQPGRRADVEPSPAPGRATIVREPGLPEPGAQPTTSEYTTDSRSLSVPL
jgi:hypothetical protein